MLPHLHVQWLPSWWLMTLAVVLAEGPPVLAQVVWRLGQSLVPHGGNLVACDLHPHNCSRRIDLQIVVCLLKHTELVRAACILLALHPPAVLEDAAAPPSVPVKLEPPCWQVGDWSPRWAAVGAPPPAA